MINCMKSHADSITILCGLKHFPTGMDDLPAVLKLSISVCYSNLPHNKPPPQPILFGGEADKKEALTGTTLRSERRLGLRSNL